MIHILSGRSGNRLSIHNHKISAARPVRIFPGPVRGGPLLPAPQTFFRPFFTPRRAFLINIVSVKDQIGQISDSITLRGWYKPLRTDCLRRPRTAKRSFDVYAVTRPAACVSSVRSKQKRPPETRRTRALVKCSLFPNVCQRTHPPDTSPLTLRINLLHASFCRADMAAQHLPLKTIPAYKHIPRASHPLYQANPASRSVRHRFSHASESMGHLVPNT